MANDLDIANLKALMAEKAGYDLGEERINAVEARLGPIARRENLESPAVLLGMLDPIARPGLTWEVIETVLPADSRFFRDREPFQLMNKQLLPVLAQAKGGPVRILSAGCATGQEAWSAAICSEEAQSVDVEIVAVDLSRQAIEKARSAIYTQFEVQRGLRSRQLINWFERSDDLWRVRESLRGAVQFERANLLDGLEPFGRFDLIFCRHVLSGMTSSARSRVLTGLGAALTPTGCLFLGTGESVPEVQSLFRPVAGLNSVYVRAQPPVSQAA